MNFFIGIKSDPIEYRYTYEWLFELMRRNDIRFLQLGSFFELYSIDDDFFYELKASSQNYGIRIKSCFTSHRELGSLMCGNRHFEKAARKNYEQYIHAASILGADFIGSSIGYIYRDRAEYRESGIRRGIEHVKELMHIAKQKNLRGLTIEPMSTYFEPPSYPEEIVSILEELSSYHNENAAETVPAYLCGDISHGVANSEMKVIHSNMELFELEIPYMAEFHFKNTDSIYNSTFGFSPEELERGIINLEEIRGLIFDHKDGWPVEDVVGYLELPGPKIGREYSDILLGNALQASLDSLKRVFSV